MIKDPDFYKQLIDNRMYRSKEAGRNRVSID